MDDILLHERAYRSAKLLEKMARIRITMCGVGAVGSNIAFNLARQGFATIRLIDRDRVKVQNLATQAYSKADLGKQKAVSLKNGIFRAVGVELEAMAEELTESSVAKLLKGSEIVIDGFDNSRSRELVTTYCRETGLACLHVGLAADYAEVMWNEVYRVPSARGEDLCDYPLARNLILMTTAAATEILLAFLETGQKASYTITLKDLKLEPYPGRWQ